MHRLVPEFIQSKYAANETAGSFYASALFVDVSGFTAITDALLGHGQHGAEVLANIIRDVFDPLTQSVFEQGGFVTNLAGDAFTAVFPADGESPQAFSRALAAAWQVQQVMATSAEHQTPYGSFPVSVKVGLAAGEVVWGIVSSTDKRRAAYYFQGSAIDGCTQAEKLAKAGELVTDATVFEAVASIVSAEPAGDHFRIAAITGVLPTPQPIGSSKTEPEILNRFFPAEATREHLSGEFRQVASVFVSLPTVRAEEQLRTFMQTVFDLQDRYGGLLNRVDSGDKGASILLFWGAPTAHENDVIMAVNFMLDLQIQTVVPVNAGITYRIAHGGYSGGSLMGEYTCHGRGTSLAARLMQASPRGEVWVDENVARRAARDFEIEFEGELAFKGFTEKQKVFVLLERKALVMPFYESKIVGRRGEMTRLGEFLQPIWHGQHPGVMVICGEPGIGKSRLVHSFFEGLESSVDQTFSIFICQTDEIIRESLNPFRYWLHRYFGQSEQASELRNKRSFNRELDGLIASTDEKELKAELDRTRSFLGALVNLDWPDSLYQQLDAQGRYENSLTGLLTVLQAESLRQPVILLLEDAQWLDDDSRAFLQQLVRALAREPSYPIAILATSRQARERNVLGANVAYQEMELAQLSLSDTAALAMNQLGSPIEHSLLSLLVERAEGNPFFAEQILRYLQEQELLELIGGEWKLTTGQETTLPSDVSAVLVARLDQLSHEVREVVQTASVLGREFEIRLLTHMLRDDPKVVEKVMRAEQLAIWSALNELRYLFKHALLRDAAYRMQVRSRRQALHKLAVEALEDLFTDSLSPHYGELAYHAEEAQLIDKARHYLELAGQTSQEAYQNSLAVDYYDRALELTPDDELDSRYRLLRAKEYLHQSLGARDEQLLEQQEMAELAERLMDVGKQAEVQLRRAWLFYWTANFRQSIEASQRATDLAKSIKEYALAGQAHYARSWVLTHLGDYGAARQHAQEALALARLSGNRRDEGNVLNGLGMISTSEGDHYAARGYQRAFLDIAREINDRERIYTALGNLGVSLVPLGDYIAAKNYFEQSLELAREAGDKGTIGNAFVNLSWVTESQGEWVLSIRYGEAGMAIKEEFKQTEAVAEVLTWLGHAKLGLDRPTEALTAYERSLKLRRELDQEHTAMGVLAGMARASLALDDHDSAMRYVSEILSHLDAGGSLDGTWEPLRIYLTCYKVLQATNSLRAVEILETANQRLQNNANKIPEPETRRMYLENVPWHREIAAEHRALASRD